VFSWRSTPTESSSARSESAPLPSDLSPAPAGAAEYAAGPRGTGTYPAYERATSFPWAEVRSQARGDRGVRQRCRGTRCAEPPQGAAPAREGGAAAKDLRDHDAARREGDPLVAVPRPFPHGRADRGGRAVLSRS